METELLTSEQLIALMKLLKESLAFFDKQCYPKVVFFNNWCLYAHVRDCDVPRVINNIGQTNIGEILDIIEPYIPLRLTEENYELFMEALFQSEEMSHNFTHKAKMDFLMHLRHIQTPAQWEETLAACESIRAIKQKLVVS